MDGQQRVSFVKHFFPGLCLLLVAYFFLTAYRDFRDNYMVEILEGLQYSYDDNQTIITRAETLVAFGVILAMGLLNFFRDNRTGLIAAFSVMTGGVILLGWCTFCWRWELFQDSGGLL